MAVATAWPELKYLSDVNVTPGVGVDEYALTYDHDTGKFVLSAPAAPFAGLLATGATVGATAQAQAFTLGVVSPFLAPAADGTTAWQVRKADKTTAVVTVDTTNGRVGLGTSAPSVLLELSQAGAGEITLQKWTHTTYGIAGIVNLGSSAMVIRTAVGGGGLVVTNNAIKLSLTSINAVLGGPLYGDGDVNLGLFSNNGGTVGKSVTINGFISGVGWQEVLSAPNKAASSPTSVMKPIRKYWTRPSRNSKRRNSRICSRKNWLRGAPTCAT